MDHGEHAEGHGLRRGVSLSAVKDLVTAPQYADCVVMATDHLAYDWAMAREWARLVVDTRRAVGTK